MIFVDLDNWVRKRFSYSLRDSVLLEFWVLCKPYAESPTYLGVWFAILNHCSSETTTGNFSTERDTQVLMNVPGQLSSQPDNSLHPPPLFSWLTDGHSRFPEILSASAIKSIMTSTNHARDMSVMKAWYIFISWPWKRLPFGFRFLTRVLEVRRTFSHIPPF